MGNAPVGRKEATIASLNPFRGDVFRALLDPTRGSEQAGTRPVVVVSRDVINQNSSVVVVVPASDRANFKKLYPGQVPIRKGAGGLTMDSVLMCEQVRAITVDRLKAYLGKLDSEHMEAIEEGLRIVLDLD